MNVLDAIEKGIGPLFKVLLLFFITFVEKRRIYAFKKSIKVSAAAFGRCRVCCFFGMQ
jgi:hypothetical protein